MWPCGMAQEHISHGARLLGRAGVTPVNQQEQIYHPQERDASPSPRRATVVQAVARVGLAVTVSSSWGRLVEG